MDIFLLSSIAFAKGLRHEPMFGNSPQAFPIRFLKLWRKIFPKKKRPAARVTMKIFDI